MSAAGVHVTALEAGNQEGYEAVLALGDRFSDRLGQLPYAVFADAQAQSRLLVARDQKSGALIGYALYRLPRNEVSLTQLCVEPQARDRGIARSLVDEITQRHRDRLGIRAKCRDDYQLEHVWTSLGFTARSHTTGRGRDRAPMTVWWKDHGHHDLFTAFEQPAELRAAIDLNILRDLAKPAERNDRSTFLLSDELAGRLQLIITSGMLAELNRATPPNRQLLRDTADDFPLAHADPAKAASISDQLRESARAELPTYPATKQDHGDLLQVAHAAALGLTVFLTWDQSLIKVLGPVAQRFAGLKVMTPTDVFLHLDELANADAFRREALAGSSFTHARASAGIRSDLPTFLARATGERGHDLKTRTETLIQHGKHPCLVHGDDGRPAALYCAYLDGNRWLVPLLRVADHPMADTLARHLLWLFKRQAREVQACVVDLADPHLSPRLQRAAVFEPMTHLDGHWYSPLVHVSGPASEVVAVANEIFHEIGLGPSPLLGAHLAEHAAARLEHAWWPAKILDSELPCYAVPIKYTYAHELFGYPEGILPRDSQLSLGREHVYYHSIINSRLTAPARVLWLATGSGPGAGHFFATSTLDDLVHDAPEQLHASLGYYGVFDLNAVKQASRGRPEAEALRISNTELFRHPISLHRYHQFRTKHGRGPRGFYGAQALPTELFGAVYRRGTADQPTGAPLRDNVT